MTQLLLATLFWSCAAATLHGSMPCNMAEEAMKQLDNCFASATCAGIKKISGADDKLEALSKWKMVGSKWVAFAGDQAAFMGCALPLSTLTRPVENKMRGGMQWLSDRGQSMLTGAPSILNSSGVLFHDCSEAAKTAFSTTPKFVVPQELVEVQKRTFKSLLTQKPMNASAIHSSQIQYHQKVINLARAYHTERVSTAKAAMAQCSANRRAQLGSVCAAPPDAATRNNYCIFPANNVSANVKELGSDAKDVVTLNVHQAVFGHTSEYPERSPMACGDMALSLLVGGLCAQKGAAWAQQEEQTVHEAVKESLHPFISVMAVKHAGLFRDIIRDQVPPLAEQGISEVVDEVCENTCTLKKSASNGGFPDSMWEELDAESEEKIKLEAKDETTSSHSEDLAKMQETPYVTTVVEQSMEEDFAEQMQEHKPTEAELQQQILKDHDIAFVGWEKTVGWTDDQLLGIETDGPGRSPIGDRFGDYDNLPAERQAGMRNALKAEYQGKATTMTRLKSLTAKVIKNAKGKVKKLVKNTASLATRKITRNRQKAKDAFCEESKKASADASIDKRSEEAHERAWNSESNQNMLSTLSEDEIAQLKKKSLDKYQKEFMRKAKAFYEHPGAKTAAANKLDRIARKLEKQGDAGNPNQLAENEVKNMVKRNEGKIENRLKSFVQDHITKGMSRDLEKDAESMGDDDADPDFDTGNDEISWEDPGDGSFGGDEGGGDLIPDFEPPVLLVEPTAMPSDQSGLLLVCAILVALVVIWSLLSHKRASRGASSWGTRGQLEDSLLYADPSKDSDREQSSSDMEEQQGFGAIKQQRSSITKQQRSESITNAYSSFQWFAVMDSYLVIVCVMNGLADDSTISASLPIPKSYAWLVLCILFMLDACLATTLAFFLRRLCRLLKKVQPTSTDLDPSLDSIESWASRSLWMHVCSTLMWTLFRISVATTAVEYLAFTAILMLRLLKLRPMHLLVDATSMDTQDDKFSALTENFASSKYSNVCVRLIWGLILSGVVGIVALLVAAAISDAVGNNAGLPLADKQPKVGKVGSNTTLSDFNPLMLNSQEYQQGDFIWFCSGKCAKDYVGKRLVDHALLRTAGGTLGGGEAAGMAGCAVGSALAPEAVGVYCLGSAVFGGLFGGASAYTIGHHGDSCIPVCDGSVPSIIHDTLFCVPYKRDC